MFRPYSMLLAVALFVIGGVWGRAAAQTEDEMKAALQGLTDAMNAHDAEQYVSYFTDDAVMDYVPSPPPIEGKEAIAAFMANVFQAFPDFTQTNTRVLTSGNILVNEWVGAATFSGEWLGIPPTGVGGSVPHFTVSEFEGNKIKRMTTYLDYVTFMVVVGLMPPAALPPLVPSFELPEPEATGLSPLEADAETFVRFNALDLFEWIRMFHQDVVARYGSLGMIPMNRDQLVALMELNLLGFPDVQIEVSREVDLGEGWVMSEFVSVGTHNGPYFGVPATGKVVPARWAILARYSADGLVMEQNIYFDNLGILMQIGAIPAPGTVVTPSSWGEIKMNHAPR